ncbi:MAG: isocitrate/isopropylmalate family dehydrogenase [bacterium]|nr:isocitrate/isopropylmalate family dehydrogenase [bacterium]
MKNKTLTPITVIPGDGIGPEVIDATLRILKACNAPLKFDLQVAGEKVFKSGDESGLPEKTKISITTNKIVLKGPLATPVGKGERSANVALRQFCKTYANIRPIKNLPNVKSRYSDLHLDFTIIRENLEGLYAGLEYWSDDDIGLSLKLATHEECIRISQLACEYAGSLGKKTVHCATKANILKNTEGLLKSCFEETAEYYPNLKSQHIIVDNCAQQLVLNPSQFDVILMSNMNGDILSDLASGLVGGLGISPSANIGTEYAIFEAVHGTAPDIAGKNCANPTAMIMSAVLMLKALGLTHYASSIEAAVVATMATGNLTADLACHHNNQESINTCTTSEFTDAIIRNLPENPPKQKTQNPTLLKLCQTKTRKSIAKPQTHTGIDVYVISKKDPTELLQKNFDSVKLVKRFALSNLWQVRLIGQGTLFYQNTLTTLEKIKLKWAHIHHS